MQQDILVAAIESSHAFCMVRLLAEISRQGTGVLLVVEPLVEQALACAKRVYALARGRVVREAETNAPDLARRIEQACLGHDDGHIAA